MLPNRVRRSEGIQRVNLPSPFAADSGETELQNFLDRRREHKGAELYVKHLEVGLDAYIARARKKAVKLHKAFVNADSSTLKGAMTKVNSAEDISKILAGLNEYKTEELGEIQLEAVGIVFEQVAAIKEKMLGLVEVPDER